jgi:glycosyltransferase involved in cell wall biosynthesis
VTPLVSFLTPAYNAATYLGETIRSVLAQTYPRIEMIVVNDGSRDETSAVAKSFGDPRVKVIDQDNRGQSASENTAFTASQGDFVVYLDADDLVSPSKVEAQVRRLQDAEPGCVAFHPWGRFTDRIESTRFVPESFWRDILPIEFHVEMWSRRGMVQGGAYLIPRSTVERAGPWDPTLSLINDFDFFPRVLLQAPRLLFCPSATLHYRSGLPGALSGSKSKAAWDSAFRAIRSGTATLLQSEDSGRTRRACSAAFEEFVYSTYPAVPGLREAAWAEVRSLGGPYFRPQMGPRLGALARIVGWKLAKRARQLTGGR